VRDDRIMIDHQGRAGEVRPDKAGEATARWDRDGRGQRVGAGVHFLRWTDGHRAAAAKVVMVD
jgi:hypothetical protein